MHFRQKLAGIIDFLHAEYFEEEHRPFGSSPSTVISQNQSQEQTMNVTFVLQLQEKLIEKLNSDDTSKEEKAFLQKIKEGLSGIKGGIETINLILSTAQAFGINTNRLVELFR